MTLWVAAAVLWRGERVLLTKRKLEGPHGGLWEFPGGKIEAAEDPRSALARELREELAIDVTVGDVLELSFSAEGARPLALVFFDVELLPDSEPPRAVDTAGLRWVLPSEVDPLELPPGDRVMLRKLLGDG